MMKKYRVIDGFDYQNKPCKLIEYIQTEERYSTENDLEANSLCTLLNEKENEISEQASQLDFLIDENKHMKEVLKQNRELKQQIKKLENTIYTYKDIIETIEEKSGDKKNESF